MAGDPVPEDAQTLYGRLRAELTSHRTPPGTILSETSVAARHGISRTPAREALTRLEQDRLIERVPRGYRVRSATAEDIMDLYEARITLESAAAGIAAMRRTELDLARLTHLSDELSRASDPESVSAISAAWHQTLWLSAHNAALTDLLERVMAQMRLFDDTPVGTGVSVETTIAEHDDILTALRRNDGETAQRCVIEHLGRTRDVRLASLAQVSPTGAP